jgi:thymidylate kinase
MARAKATAVARISAAYTPPTSSAPTARRFPWTLLQRRPPPAASETADAQDYRIVGEFKAVGLAATDPFERALGKSLYRILGAVLARRGRIGGERETLATLVSHHLANTWGSSRIGDRITPWLDAVIAREGWQRVPDQPAPVLISLKGASAAGKSSLRPMIKQRMREHGIAEGGFGTISPDVWRRLLLDYAALGPARKYAGHLTSQELMLIDGKLDRYIRTKAERKGTLPHLVVDRFRFDSFASEQVGRVLHNTYASHVDTMYMYFVVTPPDATVERGWQRALLRGRFKAVEDFLGHSVEAYSGMPKLLFKWLAHDKPVFRFAFLDNRVPKGSFPTTIAEGDQQHIVIRDPLPLIDIERYQKINIHAAHPDEVYPPAAELAVERNAGFLHEILRRFPRIELIDRDAASPYARRCGQTVEVMDRATLERLRQDPALAMVFDILIGQNT